MIEILLIAVSLAMDAFAVSISTGISLPGFCWKHAVKMGVWFGAFQFFMPLIGWLLGSSVKTYIESVDHWIAFGLLALIGGRMIWETVKGDGEAAAADLSVSRLALLALATSIDALAVGVSMAFMEIQIVWSCTIIGVVAFTLSVVGGMLGKKLGSLFQRSAQIAGGVVLICIGVKILVEDLLEMA